MVFGGKKKQRKTKMKKLAIAAVAICAAALAQAASVSWSSVTAYNASGDKLGKTGTMYVYMLDAASYAALTDVWATYGADVKAGGANAANPGGKATNLSKATVVAPSDAEANTTYYAALIMTYGSGDSMMYYAEKASVTTGDDGNGAYSTFGGGKIDTAANAATAWTSASSSGGDSGGVPEPTSGLLVLLGVAGLALKRKRA